MEAAAASALVVESKDATKPVILQFAYAPDAESSNPFWAGLTVDGGNLTFRNVHFELQVSHTPRQLAAGIVVRGGYVQFERCIFSQQAPEEPLIARRNVVRVDQITALLAGFWRSVCRPSGCLRSLSA